MSVTVTQQLTQQTVSVTGDPIENNVVVTVSNARGAEGPQGPSGASTWDEITGTATTIPFDPGTAPSHAEGKVFYDESDHSLAYYNDEADVTVNLGREMLVRVRNATGSTIADGKVVYISGATGQLPTIALARADTETTSEIIGVATHGIENNTNGYVTISGTVRNINLAAFNDGDRLYLSASTAGEMTATPPTAPNRIVQIGTVEYAHANNGKLLVHPETESVDSTDIADSTETGRALLTAANLTAARATLGISIAYKSSSEQRTNTATYADDSTLVGLALDANSEYLIEALVLVTCDAACGLKHRLVFPVLSGANGGNYLQVSLNGSSFGNYVVTSSTGLGADQTRTTSSSAYSYRYFGHVSIGASSGTLKLQWAQNTLNNGANAQIDSRSWLRVTKIYP